MVEQLCRAAQHASRPLILHQRSHLLLQSRDNCADQLTGRRSHSSASYNFLVVIRIGLASHNEIGGSSKIHIEYASEQVLVDFYLAVAKGRACEPPVLARDKKTQSVVQRQHRLERIPDQIERDVLLRQAETCGLLVVRDDLVAIPQLEHSLRQRKVLAGVADIRQLPIGEGNDS